MDKLFKSIDVFCDYVKNINNNTKGKILYRRSDY